MRLLCFMFFSRKEETIWNYRIGDKQFYFAKQSLYSNKYICKFWLKNMNELQPAIEEMPFYGNRL